MCKKKRAAGEKFCGYGSTEWKNVREWWKIVGTKKELKLILILILISILTY